MRTDADGYLDEGRPKGIAVHRIRELSLGAKLVLAGSTFLFFSLFLTWQNLEIDYGPTGTGTQMLDGWDAPGLVIGILTLGLLTLAAVVYLSDIDISADFPWELVTLVLASAILVVVAVKIVTDESSAWASYLGVVLAGVVVLGAFLDWRGYEPGRAPRVGRRRRRFRLGA
jgi:hypothetical protein